MSSTSNTMESQSPTTHKYFAKPFQLEDLAYLTERDWGANWSEMGCFKTTTLEWLMEHKLKDIENPLILIVTTKAGKGTYYQTLPEVLPGWAIYNVTAKSTKIVIGDKEIEVGGLPLEKRTRPTIVLTHYQVFSTRKKRVKDADGEYLTHSNGKFVMIEPKESMAKKLASIEWDFVALDEAHRIKDRKTNWTKGIKKIESPIKHIMTGTGFINNPAEVWSLLNFLNPKLFGSYWAFRNKYCDEYIDDAGFRRIIGVKFDMADEFRHLIRAVGPRRTKQEVFPDLDEPIYTPYIVELSPIQRRMYDSIKAELSAMDQAGVPIHSPNVLSALQRLRQICVATPEVVEDYFDEAEQRRKQVIRLVEPSSKLDALMEIIEGLEWDSERRDQLVVFSNFRDPIELAKSRFDKSGISYIHMEQRDSDRARYEKWAIEFPKKEKQVFICTLQLGSESISLTSASTCVFLDRSWSPKDNEQGVSRVWRPGQEGVANIINIDAYQTVDKRVLDTNLQKMKWFRLIFGDDNGNN